MFDATDVLLGHNPSIESKDSDVQELGSSPQHTQNTFGRQKVDTGMQTERDYHTPSGEHRDRGKRRYRRSQSPTNYYSQPVSFNALVNSIKKL